MTTPDYAARDSRGAGGCAHLRVRAGESRAVPARSLGAGGNTLGAAGGNKASTAGADDAARERGPGNARGRRPVPLLSSWARLYRQSIARTRADRERHAARPEE